MFEVDLHGLTGSEAILQFVSVYNREMKILRVVHGYGSSGTGGVIKRQLHAFLEKHADKLTWSPGEALDGNPGYTTVQPRKKLPEVRDQLAAEILEYCDAPRTEEKIAGRLRRYTARDVKEAIRLLRKDGSLCDITKSGRTLFLKK